MLAPGVRLYPDYLDRPAQEALREAVSAVVRAAPLFVPRMPRSGKPMSVRMTNCGPLGWVTDAERGYRYQAAHPETGAPWPPIPDLILKAWRDLAGYPDAPEACLINVYAPEARMGLHQDKDEQDLAAPVVSLSLGDTALFRVGGLRRNEPTRSVRLASGDAGGAWRQGPARLPWRRPHPARHLDAASARRAHQPDATAGQSGLTVGWPRPLVAWPS